MKKAIFEMYENISIGKNGICNKCNENEPKQRPLSIYFAGDKFKKGEDTVLFVGKTAVGGQDFEPEYQLSSKDDPFSDATKFGEASLDLIEPLATRRRFYNYTHAIIEKYYGTYEKGKDYVALTNIVKCNNTETNDTTSDKVKDYCINQLRVIWREVELLSPKRVVFYTHTSYDNFIDKYRPKNWSIEDITDKNKRIKIGNKNQDTPWWHRRFFNEKKEVICDFLRLGHPERKCLGYVDTVVNWLNETK